MSKKKEVVEIANLLPEGLDESSLEKIAELVSVTIQEEVKEKVNELTNKVKFFIRGNVDRIKEQAVKELELENQTFRNAQLFETVRSMFSIENTPEDEVNGLNVLASLGEQQEEQNKVLLTQVNKLLKENVKLKGQVKVATSQSAALQESLESTKSEIEALRDSKTERNLSDTALVISEDNFKVKETEDKLEEHAVNGNEWIDQSVIEKLKKLQG